MNVQRGQTSLEYLLILAGSVMIVILTASVLKIAMAPGMENLADNSTPQLWPSPSAFENFTPIPSASSLPSPTPSPSPSPTPINCACGTISSPGYYVLTGNLSGSGCITITSDNVTLDCRGYTISGGGDSITLLDANGCTVKNCRITGANWAILLKSTDNVKCNHNTIYNNTIRSSGYGIVLDAADYTNISKNDIAGISVHGIDLYKSAAAAYTCDHNRIEFNTVNDSQGNINLWNAYWTTIRNNIAYDSHGQSGIAVAASNVANTEISNNWACSNSPKDIICDSNNNVTGSGNTCTKNTCPSVVCSSACTGPVNGACGSASGYYSASIPTGAGLCSAGTASSVSGSGPWSWYCNGSNGGTNASCATVNATYAVVSFTTVGTTNWTAPAGVTAVDYLVVGGGGAGGGGNYHGGGGGAGGFRNGTGYAVTPGASYTVTVGAGGIGTINTAGANGSDSVFATATITSIGGGGGGMYNGVAAKNGGSGGGGGYASIVGLGTAGPPRQGYDGGLASLSANYGDGGGGGAGQAGAAGTPTAGGKGGDGLASSITGVSVTYAGGGGGAIYSSGTLGAGGAGGGGAGSTGGGTNGTNGLGGGGGGAERAGTALAGSGGSGVVIIRYANNSWSG